MSRLSATPLYVAIALSLASPAFAQQSTTAPGNAVDLDKIIVTGTRASDRTVLESTSPIDVLTAEDIRKAGVLNGELAARCRPCCLRSISLASPTRVVLTMCVRRSCAGSARTRCWC